MTNNIKEIFINNAKMNIAQDCDVSGESWQFDSVMNDFENDFKFSKSDDEEKIIESYNRIINLFPYLYPELGLSRADYMSTAIANAAYENNIILEVKSSANEKILKLIEENAISITRALNDLKKYGINLK